MYGRSIVLAALAVLCASPALAQSSPCELHVWPSNGLRSIYLGWFHGGINDGAVTGRAGYPAVPRDPIDTALQARLLGEIDLPAALLLPSHHTVIHSVALDSRTIRSATTRLAPEGAACYAELVVDDVFLRQDVVNGNFLQILFRFRDYGTGTVPVRGFGTWAKTRLAAFPPKNDAANQAALDELGAAYKSTTLLFATYLNKPVRKR